MGFVGYAILILSLCSAIVALCRIRHTIVLDDPFESPPELEALIPPASPEPQFEEVRLVPVGHSMSECWVDELSDGDAYMYL